MDALSIPLPPGGVDTTGADRRETLTFQLGNTAFGKMKTASRISRNPRARKLNICPSCPWVSHYLWQRRPDSRLANERAVM